MRLNLSLLSHAVALVFGAYGVGLFLFGPSLTAIAATYQVRLVAAGFLFAAFSLGFLPCVFAAGYLYERASPKWTVVTGGALIAASLAFIGIAPEVGPRPIFALALTGALLLGAGGAFLEVAGNAIMADLNPGRAALAVNYAHLTLAGGAVVGPFMAGMLMQADITWQVPYLIAAGLSLAALLVLAMQREPPLASREPMNSADARALLSKGVMWVAFAGIVLYVAAEIGVVGWVPAFMENDLGASKAASCSIVSVFWLAMTAGRVFCTWGASLLRPQTFVVVLCAAGAAASWGIGASRTEIGCYVLVALSGLAFSGIFAMVLAHAAADLGRHLGAAYGIIVSGIALGSLLFPPAMGWIAERFTMRAALMLPPLLLGAQALLYLPYVVRTRKGPGGRA